MSVVQLPRPGVPWKPGPTVTYVLFSEGTLARMVIDDGQVIDAETLVQEFVEGDPPVNDR